MPRNITVLLLLPLLLQLPSSSSADIRDIAHLTRQLAAAGSQAFSFLFFSPQHTAWAFAGLFTLTAGLSASQTASQRGEGEAEGIVTGIRGAEARSSRSWENVEYMPQNNSSQ